MVRCRISASQQAWNPCVSPAEPGTKQERQLQLHSHLELLSQFLLCGVLNLLQNQSAAERQTAVPR